MSRRQKQQPWNKNLTKETDKRILKMSITKKDSYRSGKSIVWNKGKKNTQTPWNKGKKGLQVAWNKDLTTEIDTRVKAYTDKRRGKPNEKLKGRPTWNKGLTKNNNKSLMNMSITKALNPQIIWNKGSTKKDDKRIEAYGKKLKGRKRRPDEIEACKKAYAKLPKEFIHKRAMLGAMAVKGKIPIANTSIEIKLQNILKENKILFTTDTPIMGITRVDIFIAPKTCIYADGNYWHSFNWRKESDTRQNKILSENGYIVLRFSETEINTDINKCYQKIISKLK